LFTAAAAAAAATTTTKKEEKHCNENPEMGPWKNAEARMPVLLLLLLLDEFTALGGKGGKCRFQSVRKNCFGPKRQ
jgi:hypothetical protein